MHSIDSLYNNFLVVFLFPMKKLLRTIFIIILLVGVGFLYVIKNPELPISQKIFNTIGINITTDGKQAAIDPNCISYFDGCNTCMVSGGIIEWCTKMFCETPAEPQCLEYIWTGMDLTNCISYFDGCNTCTVKNGRPDVCTEMYCETPSEPQCLEYATGTETTGTVGIANPASVNCENNGGTLSIVTQADGGQVWMCTLKDWTVCEERAYMRGECWTTSTGSAWVIPGNSGETPTACTMEYAPVCASVAVQCIKAPCPPVQQTFSNRCMMNANKLATYLHDGECTTK